MASGLPAPAQVATLLVQPFGAFPCLSPAEGLDWPRGWGCGVAKVCEGPDPNCKIESCQVSPGCAVSSPQSSSLKFTGLHFLYDPQRAFPRSPLTGAWNCPLKVKVTSLAITQYTDGPYHPQALSTLCCFIIFTVLNSCLKFFFFCLLPPDSTAPPHQDVSSVREKIRWPDPM